MSVISNNVLAGAAGQAGGAGAGYTIERSLRFNDDDSAYLNRTFAAGNRSAWTWSAWVKFSDDGSNYLLTTTNSSINDAMYLYTASGALVYWDRYQNTRGVVLQTNRVLRDTSAWYHIVLVADYANATSTDRARLYINGVRETSFSTSNYPNTTDQSYVNAAVAHYIGAAPSYLNGYLAENYFIDGQALDETSFGEFDDNGVWQPIEYTGTYGTNGYYLDFSDNSSTSALGTDSSGNSNDWTANNFSVASGAGNDSLIDTPTNYTASSGNNGGNYATLNPLDAKNVTFYDGNLQVTVNAGDINNHAVSTIGVTSGKYYWEVQVASTGGTAMIGVADLSVSRDTRGWVFSSVTGVWGMYQGTGNIWHQGTNNTYGSSYSQNDIIGIALDIDNNTITWYINGVSQGAFTPTGMTGTIGAFVGLGSANFNSAYFVNFGQRPFEYTPPTDHLSLCTANLPDPTIEDGSTVMDVSLYTGNGTSQTIKRTDGTSLKFSPDFVWIKERSSTSSHMLFDTVRGAEKAIFSDNGGAEVASSTYLSAFNSDGFSVGGGGAVNESSQTYVGWTWDAGNTTVTNTDGTITSSVRANPSAGFSVLTAPIDTSGGTIGHGLNASPSLIIGKNIDASSTNWGVWHSSFSATEYAALNGTGAPATNANVYSNTSSTTFTVGSGWSSSSASHVFYCWAPVEGYSAFGEFTGNGTTDNAFIYTGFQPRYILWKRSDNLGNWGIHDIERDPLNHSGDYLLADTSAAEVANDSVNFLSNGFKIISSAYGNGSTYLYWAFAEHPFKTSRAY